MSVSVFIFLVLIISNGVYQVLVLGDDIKYFYEVAMNATNPFVSDKLSSHSYHEMYGRFLIPHLRNIHSQINRGYRFMEIGAGCAQPQKKKGMDIWSALFDHAKNDKIWVAEMKRKCIQKMDRLMSIPSGIKFLFGDQSNVNDLQRWVNDTGGAFDAIVDDGSHKNIHIFKSLMYLFEHALAPGGLYFIEDIQVSRGKEYVDHVPFAGKNSRGDPAPLFISEVLKDWTEQLLVPSSSANEHWVYPVIPNLKGIFCMSEACVLFKCSKQGKEPAHCTR
mmetsp:Transcript_8058/g.13407  ORF Transcript_8058/g.13407 Transcript_8058/m.13407 type:complete len:277 (+) Transcript_8058:13-843(+)